MLTRFLKKAPYHTGANRTAYVAYVILDDECIFTALQPSYKGSTINYEKDIITSICELEGIDPESFKFFDLQTCKSYSGPHYQMTPDSFQYDRLYFQKRGTRLEGMAWTATRCPQNVIDLFKEHIGAKPAQIRATGELFRKIIDVDFEVQGSD